MDELARTHGMSKSIVHEDIPFKMKRPLYMVAYTARNTIDHYWNLNCSVGEKNFCVFFSSCTEKL